MKPTAIVYTSNTGFTAEYAAMLGQATGLPVYPLGSAPEAGSTVIYLGWLMAGKVQGYAKAAGKYRIAAVCGVGMGATGSQLDDVRKANRLAPALPVFTLQGGFRLEKLRGVHKLMMATMKKTVGKALADKASRTPEEDEMLELLTNGGSHVCADNLAAVLAWYETA